jgi:cold shock protein
LPPPGRYQSLIADLENSTMARGTVKWFNSQKGYGFIQPTGGGGRDIFVHISAVERAGLRSLNEGQQIEFEIEENRGKTDDVVKNATRPDLYGTMKHAAYACASTRT